MSDQSDASNIKFYIMHAIRATFWKKNFYYNHRFYNVL